MTVRITIKNDEDPDGRSLIEAEKYSCDVRIVQQRDGLVRESHHLLPGRSFSTYVYDGQGVEVLHGNHDVDGRPEGAHPDTD